MAAEAERAEAEDEAADAGEGDADGEGDEEVDVEINRAQRHRVGADAEEGGLGDGDLPAIAEHDDQAEHADGVGGGLHEDVEIVALRRREARADQHHDERLLTGLRLAAGLDLTALARDLGDDRRVALELRARPGVARGDLWCNDGHLGVAPHALGRLDSLIAELA